MRLRRLEIVGFKSFANKSLFLLDGKITVLAGPNGSGKSNVAEAVRWVLGEQRPSALRSRRADEVIFLGSSTRAPVGMAEVSLVLDNADGKLPVDFAEVKVTRRIYRSGESDYLLNGRKVRLRDITDLLLSVGLGPDTYTVIGQGAVDELIAQKPEERRIALENAADVRRHQIQLNETRNRLATTEENLNRCRDVLAELEPQARRMRTHADRAGRAREIRDQLETVSRRWYRFQYRVALERRASLEENAHRSTAALTKVQAEYDGREIAWRSLESESASLAQRLSESDQAARAVRRERDALQEQLLHAREVELQLAAEAQAMVERKDRLDRELTEQEQAAGTVHTIAQAAAERRTQARADLAAIQTEERSVVALARERRDSLVTASTQMAQLRTQIGRERQSLASQEARLGALRTARGTSDSEREHHEQAVTLARNAVTTAADAFGTAQIALETDEQLLAASEQSISDLESGVQKARVGQRDLEQEMARLDAARIALEESLARLISDATGSAVSRVEHGVVGVLGTEIRVRSGMERAISAALADRVGDVVVKDAATATDITRRVDESDGRASMVLAEFNDDAVHRAVERFRRGTESLVQQGLAIGFAVDFVDCPEQLRSICLRYLGHTLAVSNMELGLQLAEKLTSDGAAASPWQIVTTGGHLLRWTGEWRAGSDQRQIKMIVGRSELSALTQQVAAKRVEVDSQARLTVELEHRLQTLQQERQELRSRVQAVRARLNQTASQLDRERRRLAQAEQERSRLVSRQAGDEAQLNALEESIATARLRLEETRKQLAVQEETLAAANAASVNDERLIEHVRERLADVQQVAARADAEVRASEDERSRNQRLIQEIRERLQALTTVGVGVDSRRQDLLSASARQRSRLAELDASLPEKEEMLERLLVDMQNLSARRSAIDLELGEIRTRVRQAQTVSDAATLELERSQAELSRLESEIADELDDLGDDGGLQIALGLNNDDSGITDDAPFDPAEVQREMRSLKRELSRLGPVDDSALAEYQDLLERFEFLTQQSADLEKASVLLTSAMSDLEQMIQEGLGQTLSEVNAAFQRTFERLFQGGDAKLVWSTPESLTTSGIDIMAEPPGKRLQPLGNFSGGERALASVALVFALLQVNPTPFCILDEVDAALDESNVGRFAEIVREWSDRTQFVVVTHNRNTMEIADALFGISMDMSGVSRVVSLKLDDALLAARG